MITVILVIHLLLALSLVGVVLLQRSEGGGLGMGGGGSSGFLTGRGTANLLTRATAILAALFILTSLVLAKLSGGGGVPESIIDAPPAITEQAPIPQPPAEDAQPSAPLAR